jgi:hypothetical protein
MGLNLTKVETAFNVAGSIPVIAIASGSVRMLAGMVQSATGQTITRVGLIAQVVSGGKNEYKNLVSLGLFQSLHGNLNIERGFYEVLIGATVVGPLVLLGAQLLSDHKFAPIIPYN